MKTFIVVDKNANLNECSVDKLENIYKKCGLRKSEDFKKLIGYTLNEDERIELWGRSAGRNNTKNPFVFKFDADVQLYGPGAIIYIKKETLEHVSICDYNKLELKTTANSPTSSSDANVVLTPMNGVVVEKKENNPENNPESNPENNPESNPDSDSDSDSELEFDEYVYSSEEEEIPSNKSNKSNK